MEESVPLDVRVSGTQPAVDDLIPIDEAVLRYGLSRSTIYRVIRAGLTRYRRAGDRRTYISCRQLEAVTRFRPVG